MKQIKTIKSILICGEPEAKREIIHVDDLANAIVFFMNKKLNIHL